MRGSPAQREYRDWACDSRHWAHYRPRPTDIVISTYPKSGTTWMQRIVGMLVFQSAEPMPLHQISPWPDRRFTYSIEAMTEQLEAQTHRRFMKAHLPFDALPIYDQVKYVHVARDGRDVSMSWHNHHQGYSADFIAELRQIGLDDPLLGRPYPEWLPHPADEFHRWLTESVIPGHEDGLPNPSYFRFEETWWDACGRDNVWLVHFNDLKQDLEAQIARLAAFLNIEVSAPLLREIAEAADFGAMRRDGPKLNPHARRVFERGSDQFYNRGTNQRWVGLFREADLELYQRKLDQLDPALADWLQHGGATD
ncbi:MAG: sulfotransferase domain-containing protein [Pseudomonadota bacterium]